MIILVTLYASLLAIPKFTSGFSPHARGLPDGQIFSQRSAENGFKPRLRETKDNLKVESIQRQDYGDNFIGASLAYNGGHHGERHESGGNYNSPTKTIYVNVPQDPYHQPEPIHYGPPRKHYRIVFIRSPSPPPPQPIIPPRTEQKTLIYVLHPKQQQPGPGVLKLPEVTHDPEVYFVQYDKEPPTPEDLQDLVKKTIDDQKLSSVKYGGQNFFHNEPQGPSIPRKSHKSFGGRPPSPINVRPPSSNNFKRNAQKERLPHPQKITESKQSSNKQESTIFRSHSKPIAKSVKPQPHQVSLTPPPSSTIKLFRKGENDRAENLNKTSTKKSRVRKRHPSRKNYFPQPKRFSRNPTLPSDSMKKIFGKKFIETLRTDQNKKTKTT